MKLKGTANKLPTLKTRHIIFWEWMLHINRKQKLANNYPYLDILLSCTPLFPQGAHKLSNSFPHAEEVDWCNFLSEPESLCHKSHCKPGILTIQCNFHQLKKKNMVNKRISCYIVKFIKHPSITESMVWEGGTQQKLYWICCHKFLMKDRQR